jgi:hypothetical protein
MTVASDLAELQAMAAASRPESDGSLSALETIPAIYGWLIACARSEGNSSEADTVELFCRFSNTSAPEAREIAAVLGRLGYREASARLREIAGRRRRDLKPLP